MIMIFKMDINGRKAHCEIRCQEQDAEVFRYEQTQAGWILESIVAPVGEKWTNESMKLCCVHGGCCDETKCQGCDDFEFRSVRTFI